jgi:hypothetical protein
MNNLIRTKFLRKLFVFILLFTISLQSHAKDPFTIHGIVKDKEDNLPVGFVTVSLHVPDDSSLIAGTVADEAGNFKITNAEEGNYLIRISFVGYSPEYLSVDCKANESLDLGTIYLEKENFLLEEALVVGERLKAKSEGDNTVYYMNSSLYKVSNSGADLLKQLPGVQFDLMQNFTIEGKENVLIYVDGRQRDMDFVRQLDPEDVDRIELNSSPGAEYDTNTGGVVNLVLKENKQGLQGHVNAELPTSPSEIYLFPSFSLNFGREKFNLYTSYNGEFSYFDIQNTSRNLVRNVKGYNQVETIEDVRQKNWSHRFHTGFDYFINENNKLNLYASFHPYSWEQDGFTRTSMLEKATDQLFLEGSREDSDRNLQTYYSIYYEKLFNKPSTKLSADINYSRLRAENSILYRFDSTDSVESFEQWNQVEPARDRFSAKSDFSSSLGGSIHFNAGIKASYNSMRDLRPIDFRFRERNYALYNSFSGEFTGWSFNAGLRLENTNLSPGDGQERNYISLLPGISLQIKPTDKQNLNFSYRRSAEIPNIYQLNPAIQFEDPYRVYKGNPQLKPSMHSEFKLGYSLRPGKNFLSTSIFYQKDKNAIAMTYLQNETGIIESSYRNPGNIEKYGVQVSGSWKIGNFLSLNHYVKFFSIRSIVENETEFPSIPGKAEYAIESSLGAIINFSYDISFSAQFQYNSPVRVFQLITWNDPLYFCSVDKSFGSKLKLGLSTGLPFQREVSYYAEKVKTDNIDLSWTGSIQKSIFPIWLKISYRFQTGRKVSVMEREREVLEDVRKKGF